VGRIALVVLGLGVVFSGAGYIHVRRAWPETAGVVVAHGLRGEVEIRRDAWGVPHIRATTERDLFFGQGYVHAQDRLWQMVLTRGLARGELAAMFGEAALDADRATRTLGLVRGAEKGLLLLSADAREAIEGYCDGVNAFRTSGNTLPIEFGLLGVEPPPWTPLDVLLVGEAMSLALTQNAALEVIRSRLRARVGDERAKDIMRAYPAGAPVITATREPGPGSDERGPAPHDAVPARALSTSALAHDARAADAGDRLRRYGLAVLSGRAGGSNSWVVAGSRTATGRPFLANDTHLGLDLPSVWYENGLYGGAYAVVGFSLPGTPLVTIGHNERIAWGITNMNTDVEDLYLEKLDSPTAPTRYEASGEWKPLQTLVEHIPVKGGSTVDHRVAFTNHGPLVNEVLPGAKELPPLALRSTVRETGGTLFNALAALDRAHGWEEVRAALRSWDRPSLNFVYADVDGNIGYQATGRAPKRVQGHDGTAPVEGWTGAFEWTGIVPFEELPSSFNPPSGFLVAANNKVAPDSYPNFLAYDWADPYRAARITEVLAKGDKLTVSDMRSLQADTLSHPARALVPFLLAVTPANDVEREALDIVRCWDFRFETDASAPSIYYAWYNRLLDEIIGDELGDAFTKEFHEIAMLHTPTLVDWLAQGESPWFDDVRTPARETRDVIIGRAFSNAVAWLGKRFGGAPARQWRWGALHTMTFAHRPLGQSGIAALEWLFNSRTVAAPGEGYTVDANNTETDQPFIVKFGPSQRFIADLAKLDGSLSATPVGQSGLLFHPHREDQVDLWKRVDYHPMLFRPAESAPDRLVLRP
jgi:penicillin amidase